MKLLDINQRFFRHKDSEAVFYCTSADTDQNLNVLTIHAVPAPNCQPMYDRAQMTFRGRHEIDRNIVALDGDLGRMYYPASKIHSLNTQVPDSMADDTDAALRKLTKAVGGDVTKFVCLRLQWSEDEIGNYLAAEQVDAVALAIYNMEVRRQAMIVGDQTGIGKGRMAACLIRYARLKGQCPIFVTEKANLFSDIYRDLCDIGCADYKPFISTTNADGDIKVMQDDLTFKKIYKRLSAAEQSKIRESRDLKGFDYVVTNYSQFNSDKYADKINFLYDVAKGNTVILDEAHNASGGGGKATRGGGSKFEGSKTFNVFSRVVKEAENVCFLSATFAKRPDNMPLYALRTCISDAGLKPLELIQSIAQGGEALQEILAAELVREGQMLRRESTYDNIEVNYIYLDKEGHDRYGVTDLEKVHKTMFDGVADLIMKIINFESTYVIPVINGIGIELAVESGEEVSKNEKEMGAQHAPYFSKMFNVIGQILLGVKAKAVAEHALRRLKEGKKVFIALARTGEALTKSEYRTEELDDEFEAEVTDREVSCDVAVSLLRGLDGTLKYTKKISKTERQVIYLSPSELGQYGEEAYYSLRQEISSALTGVTISPIDLIAQTIEKEGYKVEEVTGRTTYFELKNNEGTRGIVRHKKKTDKTESYQRFQNNLADVIIANSSGSTGASAHATPTKYVPADQVKPRCMIIAECELNINTEVQKRGRINRTGQLRNIPPSYDYLMSAIPAEKRLMMMMQKKLRSLDANTTSNQKNSTTIIDTTDFLNHYGDTCVYQYCTENPEFTMLIGDPLGIFDDKKPSKDGQSQTADAARKITGRVAMLNCDMQEDFYNTVLDNYKETIENAVRTGNYDLEVQSLDLQAKLVSERMVAPATSGSTVFCAEAKLGTYECNVLRKPMTATEIEKLINSTPGQIEASNDIAEKFIKSAVAKHSIAIENLEKRRAEHLEAKRKSKAIADKIENGETTWAEIVAKENEAYEVSRKRQDNELESAKAAASLMRYFYAGRSGITADGTPFITLGIQCKAKTDNIRPSDIVVTLALNSSERTLSYNLATDGRKELTAIRGGGHIQTTDEARPWLTRNLTDEEALQSWDSTTKNRVATREIRHILTGNVMKAFSWAFHANKAGAGSGAQLIRFTTAEGDTMRGLLLKKDKNDSGGGISTEVYTKHELRKLRPWLEGLFAEKDSVWHTFNMTNGFSFYVSLNTISPSYNYEITIKSSKENKNVFKSPSWMNISPYGFEKEGYYRGSYVIEKHSYNCTERSEFFDIFNLFCEACESCNLKLDLSPNESQNYIVSNATYTPEASEVWQPAKNLDWSKLPQSKNGGDKAKKLKLLKLLRLKAEAEKEKMRMQN